jgi:hypothetical protein
MEKKRQVKEMEKEEEETEERRRNIKYIISFTALFRKVSLPCLLTS